MIQVRKPATKHQQGFTIVELMIATTVFSVILLLVTIMIISIGRLYTKGIDQTRVQDNVRSIVDEISQQVQLTSQTSPPVVLPAIPPAAGVHTYCIGNNRYTYILNTQIGTNAAQSQHVLWRDTNLTPSSCTPIAVLNTPNPSTGLNGVELMAPNSRLTSFSIAGPPTMPQGLYNISVAVAFGDDDLLCDSGTPGDCGSTTPSTHLTSPTGPIICKGQTGEQFCATANAKITIAERLN